MCLSLSFCSVSMYGRICVCARACIDKYIDLHARNHFIYICEFHMSQFSKSKLQIPSSVGLPTASPFSLLRVWESAGRGRLSRHSHRVPEVSPGEIPACWGLIGHCAVLPPNGTRGPDRALEIFRKYSCGYKSS